MILIVMGVAGSGKTTIGQMLASRLGWEFRDGDSFHPAANIAKMKQGIPLTDEDRRPWLLSIQSFMRENLSCDHHAIIACSALKEAYRTLLLAGEPGVHFIYLKGSPELIRQRMQQRQGHFMPANLLESQFATLEEPARDAWVVDVMQTPEAIVTETVKKVQELKS